MPSCTSFCMKNKTRWMGAGLALLLVLAALVSLCAGASGISAIKGLDDWLKGLETPEARIMAHIRWPRTLAAMLAGAALACAGVLIQGVLGNPLAGPNIIGVNAGAGFATLLISCFLPSLWPLIPVAAFLGALTASLLILVLASRTGASRVQVILAGVILSSVISAGSDLLTTLSPETALGMNTFLVGGFGSVVYQQVLIAMAYILPALLASWGAAPQLDLLSLGDETAQALGLRVKVVRMALLLLASLLAGAAVSFAGLLGFVGLIVPHGVRRIVGGEHRRVIPLSVLGGAALTLICDTVARTAFAPYEIPVGILLSLLGGPFFLLLLLRHKKEGEV